MKFILAVLAVFPILVGCSKHPANNSKHYGPSFRMVGNAVMDTSDSTKWGNTLHEAGFQSVGWTRYIVQTDSVFKDRIFCEIIKQELYPETYSGNLEVQSQESACEIVIFNYPNPINLLSGQATPDCLCTRVQNYNENGQSIIAMDCGTDPNK